MFSIQKRKSIRNKMRSKYNIKEDDIVLLYAGRIHQSKGLDLIVEAFLKCYKNNKNLKLFVVFGGGYSKYDNQMLEKLLIKKSENLKGNVIKLLKWVNHEDMIYIYSITDISILASINAEGNSLYNGKYGMRNTCNMYKYRWITRNYYK